MPELHVLPTTPRTSGPASGRTSGPTPADELISPRLALAFAPLHKRAFGLAVGVAAGLSLFAITVIALMKPRGQVAFLGLFAEYFRGYEVSWAGAFIGLLWGIAVGFIAGWFIAFCRNFALAASIFISRAKGELEETADFLDHI